MSPEDEAAKMRHELSNILLQTMEMTSPIIDAADGLKAEMERRGWSPTAAETIALQWLMSAMAKMWTG